MTNVGQICVRNVFTAAAHETVAELALRMKTNHVGSLVVVDERGGSDYPIGMVTDRDLVLEVLAAPSPSMERVAVKHVMSTSPTVVREDASIDDALHHMGHAGVRRLPVVDSHGVLHGVISLDDIVATLTADFRSLVGGQTQSEALTKLLAQFDEITQLLARERQHEQGRELDRMGQAGCSS